MAKSVEKRTVRFNYQCRRCCTVIPQQLIIWNVMHEKLKEHLLLEEFMEGA